MLRAKPPSEPADLSDADYPYKQPRDLFQPPGGVRVAPTSAVCYRCIEHVTGVSRIPTQKCSAQPPTRCAPLCIPRAIFFFFFYKEIPKLFFPPKKMFVSAAIGLRLSFVVFLVWGRGQLNLTRNERRSMLMTRPRKVLRLTISTEFYCAGGGRSIRETSQSAGPGSASSRDVVMSQYGPCRSNVERITRSANDAASLLSSRKLLSVLMKAQQRKTGSS